MSRRQALWLGQGRTSGNPEYWEQGAIATDDGTAFGLYGKTATLYPLGRAGESLFRIAHISVQHVASATIRVTPIVEETAGALTAGTGTLAAVPGIITLAQQAGEARTAVYAVPLIAEYARSGVPITRVSVRGVGLALLIETVGLVGNGLLAIDHVEIEHEPVRKAQFETVTT